MTDTKDDASVNLIRALVQNASGPVVDWDNWESMAMIIESSNNRFNSAHGYLYSPDGTISAVAARPSAVLPFVDAYISTLYKPDDAFPVKFLVEYSRASGKYRITFEDTDTTRWSITPKNHQEQREALRPVFE